MTRVSPPARPADTRTGGPDQEGNRAQAAHKLHPGERDPFEIHDG